MKWVEVFQPFFITPQELKAIGKTHGKNKKRNSIAQAPSQIFNKYSGNALWKSIIKTNLTLLIESFKFLNVNAVLLTNENPLRDVISLGILVKRFYTPKICLQNSRNCRIFVV